MAAQSFTDDYLLYLLAQASAEASAQFHGELKQRQIPVLNWRIVASLYPENALTIGALASHALANQTTLTRAVDRMEASGLVRREPSKSDRRQVLVTLTPRGSELADQLTALAKAHEASILEKCSAAEIDALKRALKLLRRRV